MAGNEKARHTIWLTNDTWDLVGEDYRRDNCEARNEYIEKAIRFYSGYLRCENDTAFWPKILLSVMEGSMGVIASRIGKLLFKLAVEEAMMMHILSWDSDVDQETLRRLRTRCVNDVKSTNGQISFNEILQFQKEP